MSSIILREADIVVRAKDFDEQIDELIFVAPNSDIDYWMTRFVIENFTKQYTNLFIPVSFSGNSHDFLGIRLIYHFRLTSNSNQLSNFYLYGPETYEEVIKLCPISSILTRRGVQLIDFSYSSLKQHIRNEQLLTSKEMLVADLKEIVLPIPKNYYDSHSIANIWGLYRLAEVANLDTNKLDGLKQYKNQLNHIYMKWLLFTNQIGQIPTQEITRNEKHYTENLRSPKIVGKINIGSGLPQTVTKALLIDDEAFSGWTQVLEQVLSIPIHAITDLAVAESTLNADDYDLIFLDMRFGEDDHQNHDITTYGGYKLLQQIRSNFNHRNFTTSVVVITATNKAWNIASMIENGADAFYIKEHPNFANDIEFSSKNYQNLLKAVRKLELLTQKRREIWKLIQNVIVSSNTVITVKNIRVRIDEKLKIGYGVLFNHTSEFQKKTLLFNGELLAYIVFWSILEELSHFFYDRQEGTNPEWKLRNGIVLQCENASGNLETKFDTIGEEFNRSRIRVKGNKDHEVSLSRQISGILRHYYGWNHHRIHADFLQKLNSYRNEVDFIHSDTKEILTATLASNQDSVNAYKKCKSILSFLSELLK
jgi:CheY-like chemotaxis protein